MKCRKCDENIPTRFKIDGKIHNSQNRKFCLQCSPFGGHNTKPDDPSRPSIKGGLKYSEFSPEFKKKHIASTTKRGHDLKRKFVELKGGCCQMCGYKKCFAALHFHHRNPSEKLFSLNVSDIRRRNIEDVKKEVDKCDLLCSNCHAEIHFTF